MIQHGRRATQVATTPDGAVQLFADAAASAALQTEARIRGAVLLQQLGRKPEALSWFDRAPAGDDPPLEYVRHLNRARLLDGLQRPGDAVTAYRAALTFAPGARVPSLGLAAALLRSGRPAEASAAAEDVARIQPDVPDLVREFRRGDGRFVRGWILEIRRPQS